MAFVAPIALYPASSRRTSRSASSITPTRRPRARTNPRHNANPLQPRSHSSPRMSGVNGGIDYEIDLSKLPSNLSTLIRNVQQGADTPSDLIETSRILAEASTDYPSLLPVLVDMLGFNNPVVASICVSTLSNAGTPAVPYLLSGVAAFNYAVNAYALRALAGIGDAGTKDVCIACAKSGPIPGVRRAACKALSALRFQVGEDAKEAFNLLISLVENEKDWGVRYAAIVGIESFFSLDVVAQVGEVDSVHRALAALKRMAHAEEGLDMAVKARAAVAVDVFSARLNMAL